jgi:hypothetical protein
MTNSSSTPRASFTPDNRPLSAEQQALLACCRRLRYGRIHRLRVRAGQPVVNGLTWTRTVKVLGDNSPHPASDRSAPGKEALAFFAQLAEIGDGEITDLQIFDGLPRTYEVHGSLPG